ncbi:hypothetical protein Tco_1275204 [Tanacetum coccineum]
MERTNPIAAQQVALDNALVAPENRVQIGKCNIRIDSIKTPKEPTYQVVLDSLALSPLYPAFLITTEVPEIYMHQSVQDFQIKSLMHLLQMHKFSLSSRNLGTKVTLNLSLKWLLIRCTNHEEPLQQSSTGVCLGKLQVLIRSDSQEHKYYRMTVFWGTLRFVSKSDEYQVYGALLPEGMTNQQMWNSPTYKIYLAFAAGAATPKKARKFKKPASPSKKKALVVVEEPVEKPKAPTKAERRKGIELLFKAASLEEAQLKKAIKRRKWETNIHQVGGSSKGADLESDVLDEPKGKSIDTSEGTGLKPGVPDVSKADSYKNEYESWGDSDDDQQSNDERTESDDDKSVDLNKTDNEEEDEFVYTPDECEPANEEKGDEEMTHVENVNAEHEEVSQEVVGEMEIISMMDIKVQHEDPSIQTSPLLTVPITVIPKYSTAPATTIPPPIPPFIPLLQQSTPIATPTTTEATISTTFSPNSSTLTAFHQRLSYLENEVKTLRNVDHTLFKTMTASKTFNKYPKHKALYHALMESILADEDAMDKGVADIQKKRKPDNADRDEYPPAGPDQGLKRRKTGKDTEQSKNAKSTRTSKGTTKSQPKSTCKSA